MKELQTFKCDQCEKQVVMIPHLVKGLCGEIENASCDWGDLKDPDNGDIRHVVDSIEQDQVECVDDGRAGEGDLASDNDQFFHCC